VTAAPEGAQAPKRRFGWVWKAVLALSLALNLCVVGGFVYFKYMVPRGPAQVVGRELNLGNDQRAAFRTFLQTFRTQAQAMREAIAPLEKELTEEMTKPEPDRARIGILIAQISDKRRDFMIAVNDALLPFLATLNPEQRRRFVEFARRRHEMFANRMMGRLQP